MKTLKDIEADLNIRTKVNFTPETTIVFEGQLFLTAEVLRKEAIEWIKEIRAVRDYKNFSFTKKQSGYLDVIVDELDTDNWADGYKMAMAVIHWIKHFFNISEEEVKDEADNRG